MKNKNFAELLESVEEGGRILRDEQKPAREFEHAAKPMEAHEKPGESQSDSLNVESTNS